MIQRLGIACPAQHHTLTDLMSEDLKALTREQLYELLWEEPTSKLAHRYGISDVAISKLCRRLKIPKPPVGYWQKKSSGRRVMARPSLPKLQSESGVAVLQQREPATPKPDRLSNFPEELRSFVEAEVARIPVRTVAERLSSPHQITTYLRHKLQGRGLDQYGVQYAATKGVVVRASKANVPRALRILDAVLKTLGPSGFVEAQQPEEAEIKILGEGIHIRVEEQTRRIERVPAKDEPSWYRRFEYRPTGLLAFRIDSWSQSVARKTWTDGVRQRVEDLVPDIVESIVIFGAEERWRSIERDRRHAEWEAEREREREIYKQQLVEASAQDSLQQHARAWSESAVVRRFVEAVVALAHREFGSSAPPDNVVQWRNWALEQADRLDPLARGLSTYLNDLEELRAQAEEKAEENAWRSGGYW